MSLMPTAITFDCTDLAIALGHTARGIVFSAGGVIQKPQGMVGAIKSDSMDSHHVRSDGLNASETCEA